MPAMLERWLGALVLAAPYFEVFSLGPVDLLDLALLPLILVWLPRAARRNRPLGLGGAELFVALFLLTVWLSLLQARVTELAAGVRILKRVLYTVVFLWAVPPTRGEFRALWRVVFWLCVFSAAVAVGQNVLFWAGWPVWPPEIVKPAYFEEGPGGLVMLRASGFTKPGPISLAIFLGPMLAVGASELLFPFLGLPRRRLVPGLALVALALYFIHSRDVWLAAAAGAAVPLAARFALSRSPARWLWATALAAAAVLLPFARGLRLTLADLYFKEMLLRGDPEYRLLLFRDALERLPRFLWLGCGFERNARFLADAVNMPVHHGFLKVLFERGLPGFLTACLWHLWFVCRVAGRLATARPEALATLALWVCYQVIILFEPYDPFHFFLLWPLALLLTRPGFAGRHRADREG